METVSPFLPLNPFLEEAIELALDAAEIIASRSGAGPLDDVSAGHYDREPKWREECPNA